MRVVACKALESVSATIAESTGSCDAAAKAIQANEHKNSVLSLSPHIMLLDIETCMLYNSNTNVTAMF